MKKALILGSSSTIADWIVSGLDDLDISCFKVSRNHKAANIKIYNYNDYPNMLYAITKAYKIEGYISSVYYCPGLITISPISESIPSEWIYDISVNLIGAYNCYRAIAEVTSLSKQETKIIFVGSTAAISKPLSLSSYSASKAALEILINSINNEPPSHIRASCLRLGRCSNFTGNTETENIILQQDIINYVKFIENSRLSILPDIVSIRPILS